MVSVKWSNTVNFLLRGYKNYPCNWSYLLGLRSVDYMMRAANQCCVLSGEQTGL